MGKMADDYQQVDIFIANQKVLAFDLETEEFTGFSDLRPVGITCAAAVSDDGETALWYGGKESGEYKEKMAQDEVAGMVDYLWEKMQAGYRITTWNGLSFDFQIVYGQSGQDARVKQIALGHVDMMFHFFCLKGFAISLDKTAQGMGIAGKPEGMDGSLAPGMWKAGQFKEVLDYVAQDAQITLDLAQKCALEKEVRWVSKRGIPNKCPLPNGWLAVQEALKLPEPDVSWMDDPWQRTRFMRWI
jgi:hypothetical protein